MGSLGSLSVKIFFLKSSSTSKTPSAFFLSSLSTITIALPDNLPPIAFVAEYYIFLAKYLNLSISA